MATPLKVVFAGTPGFAARHLEGLIDGPHQIVAVISQPDRPAGRGKRLQHSPVKTVALDKGLPVWQPETLKTAESEAILTGFDCDILIVVAYGLILPPAILQIPRLGCLNVHASLLPRWRGAAPVPSITSPLRITRSCMQASLPRSSISVPVGTGAESAWHFP